MFKEMGFKEVESRVFRTTMDHGLWDIFIGCFVLLFAVAPLLSSKLGDFWSSAIFIPFWAALYLILLWIKKSIVDPRLGTVEFSRPRKKRLSRFMVIMLFVNLAAFMLGLLYLRNYEGFAGTLHSMTLGFLVLMMASIASYYLEVKRFFIYGLLFFIALIFGEALFFFIKLAHHGFPITFGITSLAITTTGAILFIRFLREHPYVSTEQQGGDSK